MDELTKNCSSVQLTANLLSETTVTRIQNLTTMLPNMASKARMFSTLDPSHLVHYHLAQSAHSLGQSVVHAVPMAGAVLAVFSIVFAPPHEFDDLDCQSYCQQFSMNGGECPDDF